MKILKMTLLCTAAAVSISALSANSAQAADLPEQISEQTSEQPRWWTGFWIGAGVGGQFARGEANSDFQSERQSAISDPIFVTGSANADLGSDSFFGTVGAGYDFQINDSFVAGVFGDYSFVSEDDAELNYIVPDPVDIGDSTVGASFSVGDNWFVGGRLGYLATPDTLLYGLAGYSQFNVKANYNVTNLDFPFALSGSSDSWESALTVGAGVETMLSNAISAKLEYRYSNIGAFGTNAEPVELDFVDVNYRFTGSAEFDPHIHSIRSTIGYRF